MKTLSIALFCLATSILLALPAQADVISPGKALMREAQRNLPILLILALLVVTAILVRHFTKKK